MADYPTLWSTDTSTVLVVAPVYDQFSPTPGEPMPITGAVSVTARLQLALAADGTGVAGTGTGSVQVAADTVSYAPSPTDLNPTTFGVYKIQLTIVYSSGAEKPIAPIFVNIAQAV